MCLSARSAMVDQEPRISKEPFAFLCRRSVSLGAHVISCDYIGYRLAQAGFIWDDCPVLPDVSKIALCMRTMGELFEQQYKSSFDEMSCSIRICRSTAYPKFLAICQELFKGEVRWGRLVALYSFGGCLALECVEKGMPEMVSSIADWVAMFTEEQLSSWISENGGWDGFIDFYDKRTDDSKDSASWLSTGMLIACGVLCLMTIGAAFVVKT
uniref:Bcl-2 Bcl-2 homology region 1-3 domain-containing protein n=1 Tax=Trichuris muris TaxID=70415 RepID=A0A5S6QI79_TRIMR